MRRTAPTLRRTAPTLLLLCLSSYLYGQPTYSRITDTIYTPVGGLLFSGTLQISAPIPVTTSTGAVTVAQWQQLIPIRNGVLSVQLVPNDAVVQAGTNYVFHFVQSGAVVSGGNGAIWDQFCSVPSGGPWKVNQVCSTIPYSPPAGMAAGGILAGFFPSPTCPTCVIRGNNLSDLTSANTARANLGLAAIAASGSASDLGTGTVPAARMPSPGPSSLGGVNSLAPVTHHFVTGIGMDGSIAHAQPSASDITGLAAVATSGLASDVGAPTTNGTGAAGTWNISITGNAASAAQVNGGAVPVSAPFLASNGGQQLVAVTAAGATAALNQFSSSLQGLVPASGGGTLNFLRADGTFAAPPGGGGSIPTTTHLLAGDGSGDAADSKVAITSPTTSWTIVPAADNQTTTIPAGTLVANSRNVSTTSPLTGGGALSGDLNLGCQTASVSQSGCLSSSDWSTFNGKQAAGSYITAITGDLSASGPGSAAGTVVAVNGGAIPTSAAFVGTNGSRQIVAVTATSATAALNQFTSSLQGLVPASGGGTLNFLRADGTFAQPGSGTTLAGTSNQILASGAACTGGAGTCTFSIISSPIIPGHPTLEGITSTGATGFGELVFQDSGTLITPNIGVATATSVNMVTITQPSFGSTLTIDDGKMFRASNTMRLTATDGSTIAFGAGGTVIYATDSRLSDSRTPLAHAATHQNGGTDEISTATPAANAIPKAGSGGTLNPGWIPALNQNTTGTAAGFAAAYIDWNASSGGAFIQNKPSTFAPTAHNLLSASHGDTTASSPVRGGGIFAVGASPAWTQVAHSSATGGYWKWNGTDVVPSTGAASGTGSCTNQVVSATNADAAPTCTTITSAYTSGSFAPSAHASTHQNGGADEIATATAAANAIPKAGSGGRLAMGWLASGTPNGTQFVRDDGTLAVPPGGNSQSLVEPVQNSALGGSFQTGVSLLTYQSGLTNPIDYGNLTPFGVESYIFNGRNIQSDKKSIAGLYSFAYHLAAGQTVGLNTTITHPGVGDTLGVAANVYCQGFTTDSGDEGCEGYVANIYGPRNLLIAPISTSTASACSTTLAASVVKSQAPTDVKTFQVASTTGCNINDWVTLDNGVFESTDSSVENVQITAVGAGPCPGASCTLSALLQSPHSTGAPLAGSRVLSSSGYMDKQQGWGQGRIVVDNSATQVTAGTASNAGGTTITGAGTSWSTGMVGGNANLPGCFRFLADDDTRVPWGGGNTLHQWWPIQSVSNSGTLILSRIYAGPPRSGASYAIAPCGRIGAIAMSYGTTSETITGIVLDNTSLSWTVGHNMEQAISPYASYQRGMSVVWNSATSLLGHGPIMFDATNGGYGRSPAVLQAEQSAAIDSSTAAGYFYGINLIGNTSAGKITLPGKDLSGLALGIRTYNDGGIPDPGMIQWSRGPSSSGDGFILPNVTSGQFMMGTSTSKVQFSDDSGHPGFGVLWDYSAPVAASHLATITIPDASGNICLSTTCVTSTPLTRNLPDGTSLNEVDIGSWTNSGGQGEIYGQICVYDNATSNRPCKVYSFAVPWNGADYTWKQVVPVNEALSGDGFDYALDVQSVSGVVSARLRNSGTTHHSGVAAMDLLYGGQVTPYNTFTPSTATASVSAPTQVLANTVVKQSANKLGIVNASGFTATLDPTALTADRTITQPDLAGTMALSGSSQLVSFGNLAAGSGTYVQSSDPGCANTGQIGRFWFNTTTTTTVLKACMNVAGTLTWVTK